MKEKGQKKPADVWLRRCVSEVRPQGLENASTVDQQDKKEGLIDAEGHP